MLDLKYLNPRKDDNKCKLVIKGDWNDADYITEDTTWSINELNENLPYFSIMVDLFKFDYDFRHKFKYSDRIEKYGYRIDIRDNLKLALEFYLNYKNNFYPEILNLKNNDNKILSDRLIALDKDRFDDVYNAVITDIEECLGDRCSFALPSYEGWGIHSIKEIYIDYKGNKYDILPNKTLEAFADLMDREYDNFSWSHEDE